MSCLKGFRSQQFQNTGCSHGLNGKQTETCLLRWESRHPPIPLWHLSPRRAHCQRSAFIFHCSDIFLIVSLVVLDRAPPRWVKMADRESGLWHRRDRDELGLSPSDTWAEFEELLTVLMTTKWEAFGRQCGARVQVCSVFVEGISGFISDRDAARADYNGSERAIGPLMIILEAAMFTGTTIRRLIARYTTTNICFS